MAAASRPTAPARLALALALLGAVACGTPLDAERRAAEETFQEGLRAFEAQRFAEAEASFLQVLSFRDTRWHDEATYFLGRSRYAQGNYPGAIEALTALHANFRSSPFLASGAYYLGRSHLDLGDPAAALPLFEQVVVLHPGSPDVDNARYFAGRCLYELGELLRARAVLEDFERSDSGSPWLDDARYYLARTYFDRGEYAQAIPIFERVLRGPDSTRVDDVFYHLGRARFELGELEAALVHLRDVVALFPSSPFADDALHYQVRIHVLQADCAAARTAYEALRTSYPESPERPRTEQVLSAGGC